MLAAPPATKARLTNLGSLARGPGDRDEQNRSHDDGGGSDRKRGDADRGERIPTEQCEACAEEGGEQIVEAEQIAALRRARAVGELRSPRAEGDVPAYDVSE